MYRDSALSPLLVTAFREKLFGIERATGAIKWRTVLNESGSEIVELAIDEQVIVACTPTHLAFLDYATGEIRKVVRRTDTAKGVRAVMVLDGGHLFIGGTGELACYTADGDLVWDQGFKGEGYGEVALGFPHRVRQADHVGR